MLGVSGCPQCLCPDGELGAYDAEHPTRTFAISLDIIRTARKMLLERGNITAAKDLLKEYRLSELHLLWWNPFFLLPHTDYHCFPQDHLHGV